MTFADQPHAVVYINNDGKPRVCIPDDDTNPLNRNLAIYPTREIAESWLSRWGTHTGYGGIYFTIPAAALYNIEESIAYRFTER